VRREPVAVAGIAGLLVTLGLKLGLPVDDDVAYAIASVVWGLLIAWARSRVTPVAAPNLPPPAAPAVSPAPDQTEAPT